MQGTRQTKFGLIGTLAMLLLATATAMLSGCSRVTAPQAIPVPVPNRRKEVRSFG